ncbi:MAG: magnesium/cobalt transporter CorA [Sedimentisphaerales bacterium]|nr:magnesium/cobalt transporter CorA [Sedimentisphaerales bacterium]
MARTNHRHSRKAGLPPGTLVHIGEKKTESVRITLINYDAERFEEKKIDRIEQCFDLKDTSTVTWINIDGLHDVGLIEKIGSGFGLHPLVLEDLLNSGQRPKFEDFESYAFIVFKMLGYDEKKKDVLSEQVSLILGRNFVLSIQEQPGDVFDGIRERIRNAKGRIRKMGCDYLAYALLDAVVDSYFGILEKIGDRIEIIEEKLVSKPDEKMLHEIHNLKSEMLYLRKSVWPLREVISGLTRAESELITDATGIYLRDVYDHTVQVIDTIESYRDMVSGMLDIYLSSVSNRMNAVMKVLTIIATIFMPLGFFAGVYGMNFEYMPELKWRWAYPVGFWGVIVIVVLGMLIYFKRKKWL